MGPHGPTWAHCSRLLQPQLQASCTAVGAQGTGDWTQRTAPCPHMPAAGPRPRTCHVCGLRSLSRALRWAEAARRPAPCTSVHGGPCRRLHQRCRQLPEGQRRAGQRRLPGAQQWCQRRQQLQRPLRLLQRRQREGLPAVASWQLAGEGHAGLSSRQPRQRLLRRVAGLGQQGRQRGCCSALAWQQLMGSQQVPAGASRCQQVPAGASRCQQGSSQWQ
jgi:hypothetical protein